MPLTVDALPERIAAALAGASAAEAASGCPAGVHQLLALTESLAIAGELDDDDARVHGLDLMPPTGPAGLLLRAVPVALLTPLDRPRLRRTAHRAASLARADEGTAVAAIATAALTADLCRFDLETALIRLHQTLLEEAPMALLSRLRPLDPGSPAYATGDPVDALQMAITLLDRGWDIASVIDQAAQIDGEPAAATVLAGALAGVRSRFEGMEPGWRDAVPAAARVGRAAAALASRAVALLPG